MDEGAPNSGVVNMTRALEAVSPMLNNPRQMIFKVKVLLVVVAALMLVQFILLDFCKRLRQNAIVSFALKVCDKAMFPLIVYTLGIMQTSPIKNSVYPLWAVALVMASGATAAIKQSDRPTIESLLPYYIEVLRYLFYYYMFIQLLSPTVLQFTWYRSPNASSTCTIYLFALVVLSKFVEGGGRIFLGFSYSRGVAEWTKKNLNIGNQSDCDPAGSMNDYNYLVSYGLGTVFNNYLDNSNKAPSNENVITVDQIWDCFQNSDEGIPADDKKTLKDACLSLALFELLKRRYFGFICAEASLRKTQDFVFKVLLRNPDDDYKRTFRLIETELGFCYDFLFTKHPLIYATGQWLPLWIVWFMFFLGRIFLICMVGVYALRKSLVLETTSTIIEVHSEDDDYNVALAILCLILMVKLLQVASYLTSDWFKVSLTCTYVKRKSCAPIAFSFEKAVGFLNRITISARCKNTIGQLSFLFDRIGSSPWNKLRLPSVQVSDAVKKAIAKSLKSADGKLTNGERALRMFGEYDWTLLKDHSQIEVMLIWHIATDYCDHALSDDGEDRSVAVNLSRYYAYLIAYIPELLPYHVGDIRELTSTVCEEVKTLSSRWPSITYSRLRNLEGTEAEDNPTTIFRKGVKLGKQLEILSYGVPIWKMMAEFWAETMIYITPSHFTAKKHMELLESGGEFLTHIWVLLSHAGILNLDREKDQGAKPARSTAETA